MNGTEHRNAHLNAHLDASAAQQPRHLAVVATPTAAQLARMVGLDRRSTRCPAPLRLTRRGRLVVVLLVLIALSVAGLLFGAGVNRAGATDAAGPPREYRYVVVQPGQTLWAIAKEVAPGRDPRATVESIRRLNSLTDAGVQAGQRIALP